MPPTRPIEVNPSRTRARGAVAGGLALLGTFLRMLRDPRYRFPGRLKLLAVVAVVYLISPIDLIPDIFVPFGFVDDLGLLAAVASMLLAEIRNYERR